MRRMENSDGDWTGNRKRVKTLESYKKYEKNTPTTKKRRIVKTNNEYFDENVNFVAKRTTGRIGISSMPVEILLEIMSYLDCRDLYSLQGVSKFFERLVLEPSVWTTYEVSNSGPTTLEVIDELKRMPHLRRISIEARNDCDDILRQLSCSNKKLQRLNITNCTGTSANLYLRPAYLVRILERCSRLHTITIRGSRFRGLKFYRILGDMGHRLRFVSASTTSKQFRTFATHVSKVDENERDALCAMCPGGARRWGPLRYYMIEKSDRTKTALVSYFHHDFLYVDLRPDTDKKTGDMPTAAANSFSPVTLCSS
ncbi:uncharacterized protein [Venturia canescens]|uniref:uncharacterized protein isoform X2 n=1 Tax=Venturia canescens TaxID=32260 RepID=UPI001C9C1C9F|nr:uncharacterized protein LOC122408906 isoform X2 [Venturia canescens]